MKHEKPNITVYSSLPRSSEYSSSVNILHLIKKNKEEERRDKVLKMYTLLGFAGLIFLLGLFMYYL